MVKEIELNELVPILRYDLNFKPYEENGEMFIILSDPFGYATEQVIINSYFYNLFIQFAVEITAEEVKKILDKVSLDLAKDSKKEIIPFDVFKEYMNVINQLNDLYFLISDKYFKRKEEIDTAYNNLETRPPVTAGSSYPAIQNDASNFFRKIFSSTDSTNFEGNSKAIIVPHLDFNAYGDIEKNEVHQAYSSAYHSIKNTDADVYIVLGTSHIISTDYFMLTEKNYETVLGVAQNDDELISELKSKLKDSLTVDELAHKMEHSIEYQIILLQHYFNNPNIKVLPILCGSTAEEIASGNNPILTAKFSKFISALKGSIEKLGRKPVFIASVDFAHIGKKFGDSFDAKDKAEESTNADMLLIQDIEKGKSEDFFKQISDIKDKWRVCGISSISALLNIIDIPKGRLLKYGVWYEEPTQSSVSYASISFDEE